MAGNATRGRLWLINGLIALVVVLAIVGTVVALTRGTTNPTEGLRTVTLGRGTVAETVTASGAVTAGTSSTVNFNVTGRIEAMRVKLGQRVTTDQVLAILDPDYARANLKAARAQRDAAAKRVTANSQALDAAKAAANVPIDARSGTSAQAGAQGAQGGTGTGTGMGTGTGTGASTGTGTLQQPSPQQAQPQSAPPAKPPPPQPAPQAAPPPVMMPVAPPWWCFWCTITYQPVQPSAPVTGTTDTAAQQQAAQQQAAAQQQQPAGQTAQAQPDANAQRKQEKATEEQDSANVKAAKATLAESKANLAQTEANLISAQRATEDLELVAPQNGTVVSLDGTEGQVVGPQGIVTSRTDTGNPTGGRLPDGSAVQSGAGGTSVGGAGGASGGAGGAGAGGQGGQGGAQGGGGGGSGGAAAGGGTGTGVTAAPTAPAVLTLADLGAMQVQAEVPELDVGRVEPGQRVDVRVNALPGQTVPGRVATVNFLPGSGTAVEYGTSVALPVPPRGMRPGMSASVSIVTRSAPNVQFLPSAAIKSSGEGATTGTVDVLVGPEARREVRTIGLGLSSDTVTQVTSGLADGERVVLPDPNIVDPFQQGGGGPPGTQGGDSQGGSQGGN